MVPAKVVPSIVSGTAVEGQNSTPKSSGPFIGKEKLSCRPQYIHYACFYTVNFREGEHRCHFDTMRGMYGIFCLDISDAFTASMSSVSQVNKIKVFLQRAFGELEQNLCNVTTVEGVLHIVFDKCNLINIAPVDIIANHFKITEAKKLITGYQKSIDEFCSHTKIKGILDKLLSTENLSKTDTVQFVLSWEADDHTLNDIRRLLEKALEVLNKRIIIQSIHKGNSIIIICYAPHHLLAALLLEAQNNLAILVNEFGLISLSIGQYTVYDKRITCKV